MDEVWRGIPVTDEALTQCIRTLRKQLGDDAARPRFIETVPKHGYRFIATVGSSAVGEAAPSAQGVPWRDTLFLARRGRSGAGSLVSSAASFTAWPARRSRWRRAWGQSPSCSCCCASRC